MIRVSEVTSMIESWAPKEIAWERDNVGLQLGDPSNTVRGILVCLDITEEVLAEAKKRKANLVVSHHPLLFRPPHKLLAGDPVADCVSMAARSGIDVYAAHTNLDFTAGGTSFALADSLGLRDVDFMVKSYKTKKKIVTYVPPIHADNVAGAMAKAGAGRIGNYDACSFRTEGIGTFLGNERSNPRVGKRGKLEQVEETRLEMIVDEWNVGATVRALIGVHPYEEPSYEIYPTENISNDHGLGSIGQLETAQRPASFLRLVKRRLGAAALKCGGRMTGMIRRVALCGGSGSELLAEAIRQKADAFVTADVKYHSFHDAGKKILFVDAGHYETEFPVVRMLAKRIKEFIRERGSTVPVVVSRRSTNPITYV